MTTCMCVGVCVCVCVCVCCLLHTPLSKAHVGALIYCRRGALANWQDLLPEWRSCGTLGTEGREGETPDQDIQEFWGWALSDLILTTAATEAHLQEWL